jgi:hypothetical protein
LQSGDLAADAGGGRGEAGAAARHDCREEFNPKVCAECRRRDPQPANTVTRWSMHHDERGIYNPRCKCCRERGEACDTLEAQPAP